MDIMQKWVLNDSISCLHIKFTTETTKNSSCHFCRLAPILFASKIKIYIQVYIFMQKHKNMVFNNLKENLPEGHAIVQMDDFAKNFWLVRLRKKWKKN